LWFVLAGVCRPPSAPGAPSLPPTALRQGRAGARTGVGCGGWGVAVDGRGSVRLSVG